jgi:predicted amidohydrolase
MYIFCVHVNLASFTYVQVILYPTAIGSEPQNPTQDSYKHWCRVQQGHAAANMVRGADISPLALTND